MTLFIENVKCWVNKGPFIWETVHKVKHTDLILHLQVLKMAVIGVSITGILYSHIIETVRILFIVRYILTNQRPQVR